MSAGGAAGGPAPGSESRDTAPAPGEGNAVDPRERADRLLRDLRTRADGLSEREAARRLVTHGANTLERRAGPGLARELLGQFVHPLALLLWGAAAMALATGLPELAIAILVVIALNGAFAFLQEYQAERSVEALLRYLPPIATVVRGGVTRAIEARELVPGDIMLVAEGDRVSADARLLEGAVSVDMSALTGESAPSERAAASRRRARTRLDAPDLVFGGTVCTSGTARAVVFATGMRSELGRIASLTQRVKVEAGPLQHQVARVAKLIAIIAVAIGVAFLPFGLMAGLDLKQSAVFAVGLLVANVPEGLLPTITLALAVGVRRMARRNALVKRLTAVETLGSTTVICTDKTGTLTENRMTAETIWTLAGELALVGGAGAAEGLAGAAEGLAGAAEGADGATAHHDDPVAVPARRIAAALVACNNASITRGADGAWHESGDPTESALLVAAAGLGADTRARARTGRRHEFRFDPALKLMSTLDADPATAERAARGATAGEPFTLHTKGAPESVLVRCSTVLDGDRERPLGDSDRARIIAAADDHARRGLRVLAVADRSGPTDAPADRAAAETGLTFLGLVALIDPPRHGVAEAVRRCHAAGIRVILITGDHELTAIAIARRVGISGESPRVVSGHDLELHSQNEIGALIAEHDDVIFARAAPEDKLRIADALQDRGEIVAMTGDGVNDAPALRGADIGVAMGASGTDVAREAAEIVLIDDNFATIVGAVEEGRMIYDNIRKFVLYIFAHAPPEVVPFLLFALSGGSLPLPLTVMQILAIDLGTETLPALALGRERAEPGVMRRPPRSPGEPLIGARLLVRAWLFLGAISAALVIGGYLYVLWRLDWSSSGAAAPHAGASALPEAATMTFLGITACQIGTAMAARTDRAALREIGVFTNRLLLVGIVFEIVLALMVVYVPPLQPIFGTAPLSWDMLLVLAPFPLVVWGADELRRGRLRRRVAPRAIGAAG